MYSSGSCPAKSSSCSDSFPLALCSLLLWLKPSLLRQLQAGTPMRGIWRPWIPRALFRRTVLSCSPRIAPSWSEWAHSSNRVISVTYTASSVYFTTGVFNQSLLCGLIASKTRFVTMRFSYSANTLSADHSAGDHAVTARAGTLLLSGRVWENAFLKGTRPMGEQLKFKNENMTQKEGPAVTIMPVSSIVLELRDARKNDIEEAKGCHRHAQALASCICKVNPPESWLKLSQI